MVGGNFKLGADGKKVTFSFQKCRTSGKFCQPFNQPFAHGYFSKAQTLFYGISEDGKSHLWQSTVTDAVCLMNLLFQRSVKWQAHCTVLLECPGSRRKWLSTYCLLSSTVVIQSSANLWTALLRTNNSPILMMASVYNDQKSFCFSFIFKFGNPSEVLMTKTAKTLTLERKLWRILVVLVNWCHRANGLFECQNILKQFW